MTMLTGEASNDADVVEALRQVARETDPPLALDIDVLLTRGRRARRMRQAILAPAWTTAALLTALTLALVFNHVRSSDRSSFLAPAGLATERSRAANLADADQQAWHDALGPDFSVDWQSGEVTVHPGSASADGLPGGLTLWTQIFSFQQGPQSGELSQFCTPMVEKNVIFASCTSRVLASGKTIYVQLSRTGPGGVRAGRSPDFLASDGVRVMFVRSDGELVIVDLSTQGTEAASSPERRAANRAWLNGLIPRLGAAAADPRVVDDSRPSVGMKASNSSRAGQ